MPKPFKKIALFGKRHREKKIASTLIELKKLLQTLEVNIVVEADTAGLLKDKNILAVQAEDLSKHCDLIIVVGGDGSLLSAARVAAEQNLPVLGINRGRLGFLTDIRPDELAQVKEVLLGNYQEEQRFLLHAKINHQGRVLHQQDALNDVVLMPGDVAHMIEFSIYINDEFVYLQRADGLIITTPTGSTAYALSGGGPIMHPDLNAIALVPMFPHTLSSRPIVISAESDIKIVIDKHNETSPRISCDGQERLSISPGDTLHIRKKSQLLRLIHPANYQYFATLRAKLQWEAKPY